MKLQELRLGKKLSQKRFARAIGEKQSTVSMWEGGHSTPSLQKMKKIATALEVSLSDIVNCFVANERD